MDTGQSVAEESPEVIREQIEETRAALGQKLESLESEVRTTVQGAQDSVKETVDNVKKAFDVRYHVETRPWLCVGAMVGAGALLGMMMRRDSPSSESFRGNAIVQRGQRSLDWARGTFQPELQAVKSAAVGAGISLLTEFVKDSLPPALLPRAQGIISGLSKRFGLNNEIRESGTFERTRRPESHLHQDRGSVRVRDRSSSQVSGAEWPN